MKSFLLLHDFGDIINMLSDSEAGKIIKAVFDYEINSVEPVFTDRTMRIVFFDIKRFLDSNRENYEKVCKLRSEYAKKRWSEKNSSASSELKDAQACLSMHKHTAVGNTNVNDNVNVKYNLNDNVNVNADAEQTGLQKVEATHINKKAYGLFSNVFLTDEEYRLITTDNKEGRRKIDSFSAYMRSSGKAYNDHYARLINWSCYENNGAAASCGKQKQPGERREPTFDVSEFTKKARNLRYVPPKEE